MANGRFHVFNFSATYKYSTQGNCSMRSLTRAVLFQMLPYAPHRKLKRRNIKIILLAIIRNSVKNNFTLQVNTYQRAREF